ncbi:hypothetical protein DdX_22488 [Ditylenchus destructor]|uniref:Uncharacterized protein n=1 Tax=Ditylenchus destructor TaxID=166010 RepID=A0AAD4MFP5_9BILA|nr:hypothetical protein DdX_22488 [Ditylenchus destructor]
MGWPTKCPGNKCPYAVKDVAAPGPGQKYIMNVSLHYKYFGSNSGEPDNRLAWSRVFTVAQAGENTVNLKYDAGVPNLLRG